MHKVQEGPASQSYGLQVAKLAGIPLNVVNNAKEKLVLLEQQESQPNMTAAPAVAPLQSDLFAAEPDPAIEKLASIDPDDLTPRQALDLIYQLKQLSKG